MEITKEQTSVIKGLAIGCMLWHHLFAFTGQYGFFAQNLGVLGKICVTFFLFLSGYGMTMQYAAINKKTWKHSLLFIVKRFIKFYTAYWFVFVIIIVVGVLGGRSLTMAYPNLNPYKSFFLDFWGLMGYRSYIPTWWFNKLIIQMYLLFPLLYLCLSKKILALMAVVAFLLIEQFSLANIFCVVEGGLFAFFMGMYFAKYPISIKIKGGFFGYIVVTAVSAVLVIIRFKVNAIRFTVVDAFIVTTAVFLLVGMQKHYAFPIMKYLGKHSANMYLNHTLFILLFSTYLYQMCCSILVFIVLLGTSLTMSIVIEWMKKTTRYNLIVSNIVNKIRLNA